MTDLGLRVFPMSQPADGLRSSKLGTVSVSKYLFGRNPLYTQLGYRGIKQGAKGEARPELKKTEKAKKMDTASAAKKAFIRQHDANPAIKAIMVGVLRDPESDLCTDGGFVLETNLDVESKQVQEWNVDRAYETLTKILEGYGHAVPMEGTLWRVEYRGETQEPVARLLAVIVQE